jgi:uncharacterized protein (DUF952 family)
VITYHLVARDEWESQRTGKTYVPEAFARDGFVHCTDGEAEVIATANRYYQDDARPYVVLSIATDRLAAPVRYEDDAHVYPHVYGPIEIAAVTAVRGVDRDSTGTFLRIASAPHGSPLDR